MRIHGSRRAAIARRLLAWYDEQARDLPWRRTQDPYRIWVSEVMLQQTRVETVVPYYERWLRAFPDIQQLAAASVGHVLQIWEGLGYYARARNLHRAAAMVATEYGGQLPANADALQRLPGIGRYTAGAIASIAFGAREPVLDGNVKRVLARLFDLTFDIRSASGAQQLWALAEQLVPPLRPGDFNQALMELGALVCTSGEPACRDCPLRTICAARKLGVQSQRPLATQQPATPHYDEVAAIIRQPGRVLIVQRPAQGLLGGLWRFPGGRPENGEAAADCLRRILAADIGSPIKVGRRMTTVRHAYTHFRVTVRVHECSAVDIPALPADYRWADAADLELLAMGKVDRTIANGISRMAIGPLR